MARVLLTGATGFIGGPAVEHLLAAGHEVHYISRDGGEIPDATCHRADLLGDGMALKGLVSEIRAESLLHLAWVVEPGRFWSSPENFDWFVASLSLYRAFATAGGRRMVIAGTCAEYDWSPAHASKPLDEQSSAATPATLYGQAKKSTYDLLSAAARLDGLSLASGRVFFPYGPREKPGRVVSDVVANLLRGQIVETTEGSQSRDFMHVSDVAAAFVALLDHDTTGAVNIATGIDLPLSRVLREIAAQIGHTDLLRIGARAMAANDPPRLAASVSRLREEVGFVPKYDLSSGLANTIEWCRRQLDSTKTN